MPLKFSANLTTMFPEIECKKSRYRLAKDLGFRAAEAWDMYDVPLDQLVEAKEDANLKHILVNSPIGLKGDWGLACLPSRQKEYLASLDLGFTYAKALDCRMFHVLAGQPLDVHPEVADLTYRRNLELAVKKAEKEDIQIVIEPVSRVTRPDYFLSSINKAMDIIREFNTPHLQLLLDIYHLQFMCGNLSNTIKEVFPWIGHVQFAQVPDRHEPDSPGEINYRYVFGVLEHLGYDKWVGCEYFPKGRLEDGLHWIKDFGYTL